MGSEGCTLGKRTYDILHMSYHQKLEIRTNVSRIYNSLLQGHYNLWNIVLCNCIYLSCFLYDISNENTIPSIKYIENEAKDFLDFNTSNRLRAKRAGVCALEYEIGVPFVLAVLIWWNHQMYKGTKGIFGEVEAYGNSCEWIF